MTSTANPGEADHSPPAPGIRGPIVDDWSHAFVQHWRASHRGTPPPADHVLHLDLAPLGGDGPLRPESSRTPNAQAALDAALADCRAHSLDLVVGLGALKLYPCPSTLMRRLSTQLKHGGRLLLSTDHPYLKNRPPCRPTIATQGWLKNKITALLQQRALAYYEQAAANGLEVIQIVRSGRSIARPQGADAAPDLTSAGVAALGVFVEFRRRDPSVFLRT